MVRYLGGAYYVHLKRYLILKMEAILSSETLAPVCVPYNVKSQPRRQQLKIPSYWCLNQDSTADRTGTCRSSVRPRTLTIPFIMIRCVTQTRSVFQGVFHYVTFYLHKVSKLSTKQVSLTVKLHLHSIQSLTNSTCLPAVVSKEDSDSLRCYAALLGDYRRFERTSGSSYSAT